jgi:hypothetical protein
MVGLNSVMYEDIEVWFMDSGSSRHMTRMRSVFLTFSKIDTDFYVGSGTNTRQAIRGFGYVRFQLESGRISGNRTYVICSIFESKPTLSCIFQR